MILVSFVLLQMVDLLTTLLFLHNGVREGNPLIRAALTASADPVIALLLAKLVGVTLGIVAWRMGRRGLLGKLNVVFAACVVWNLVAAWVGHS